MTDWRHDLELAKEYSDTRDFYYALNHLVLGVIGATLENQRTGQAWAGFESEIDEILTKALGHVGGQIYDAIEEARHESRSQLLESLIRI